MRLRAPSLFIAIWGALMFASPLLSIGAGSVPQGDFEDIAAHFEFIARRDGGESAFAQLREATLPANIDLHLLGHRIGDILYEQRGIEGMAVCTDDFRNACSHTMVIGALTDYGESALPAIRDACKRAPGGSGAYTMCYHGLGHGVFAFYDYSLPETVALCIKTGTEAYGFSEARECIGGAIMELSGGGGHDPESWRYARARYLSDPIALCESDLIPETAQAQCLTYITPELWKKVGITMGSPDPHLFRDAFALCNTIDTQKDELRYACFGGFGKEFIPLVAARDIRAVDVLPDTAYRTALEWCEAASVTDGIEACISQAVYSLFWGGENDPEASFRFCNLASEKRRDICDEALAQNIEAYTAGEARRALCARVPLPQQSLCES